MWTHVSLWCADPRPGGGICNARDSWEQPPLHASRERGGRWRLHRGQLHPGQRESEGWESGGEHGGHGGHGGRDGRNWVLHRLTGRPLSTCSSTAVQNPPIPLQTSSLFLRSCEEETCCRSQNGYLGKQFLSSGKQGAWSVQRSSMCNLKIHKKEFQNVLRIIYCALFESILTTVTAYMFLSYKW